MISSNVVFLRLLVCTLAFLCFSNSYADEKKIIFLLDIYCLRTEVDTKLMEKMLAAADAKKVPPEFMNQSPAMAGNGGIAYILKENNKKYMIAATYGGGCTVMGSAIPSLLESAVKRNYRLKHFADDDSGVQVEKMWFIDKGSRYSGGMISLTFPKDEFSSGDVITLSYVPENIVQKMIDNNR